MTHKIDLQTIVDDSSRESGINANNTILEAASDNTLSRDGTSPNQMESALDMNGNTILNLPEAEQPTDPVRLEDLVNYSFQVSQFSGIDVNVMQYIPASLQPSLIAGTSLVDVTTYLNQAHAAAGVDGRVRYPKAIYPCQNVMWLQGQAIKGSGGASSILQQIGNQHCLVQDNFQNNVPLMYNDNPSIEAMGFQASANSSGGYGVVSMSNRLKVTKCIFQGIGIFPTVHTRNGTIITNPSGGSANIAGMHFLDNNFLNCSNGAISCRSDDKVTDCYWIGNIISNCGTGSASGSGIIPSFNTPGYSGWIIAGNKFQAPQASFLDTTQNDTSLTDDQSTQIFGNLFDWKCSVPSTSGTNVCIYLTPNNKGRISIIGNVFKGPRGDASLNYTYIYFGDSGTFSGNSIVSGNSFDLKGTFSGTVKAVGIQTQANTPGLCSDNTYDGFTISQRGDGEIFWGPQMSILTSIPSGTGMAGQYGVYTDGSLNNFLYVANGSGVWKKVALT